MSGDTEDYKGRNVIERAFNKLKKWLGLATRYDKHALVYRGGMSWPRSSCGCSRNYADTP